MIKAKTKWFSWYLSKYVGTEVFFGFIMGTTIFLLIMLMLQYIRLAEFFVVQQVGLWDVTKLSIYLMTSLLPIAVPIAFLFAVLMGISRANSEGEMIALQATGVSILQVFSPLFVFAIFVTTLLTFAALYTVPQGNRKFELLITRLSSERAMASLKPGVFQESFGGKGLVLFAEQIIPIKNEMKRVFIFDEREEQHPLVITTEAGLLKSNLEKELLTLRLTNGSIFVDKKQLDGPLQKIKFDVYDINMDVAGHGDSWREYSPPSFNYDQLQTRLKETIHDPPLYRQLQVELHRRFSLSFACIIFAGLGFFIGTMSQRGIRSGSIVLCLVVGLIYWLSAVGANALALSGWVVPWIGVWLPNVVFAGISYYLYRRQTNVLG